MHPSQYVTLFENSMRERKREKHKEKETHRKGERKKKERERLWPISRLRKHWPVSLLLLTHLQKRRLKLREIMLLVQV